MVSTGTARFAASAPHVSVARADALTVARALALYRVSFSGLIIAASAATLASDHSGHAQLLAVPEILGAVLLLWRRLEIAGAGVLLIVFAAAQTLLAFKGQWSTVFLQYAASVIFIVLQSRSLRVERDHGMSSTNENN